MFEFASLDEYEQKYSFLLSSTFINFDVIREEILLLVDLSTKTKYIKIK